MRHQGLWTTRLCPSVMLHGKIIDVWFSKLLVWQPPENTIIFYTGFHMSCLKLRLPSGQELTKFTCPEQSSVPHIDSVSLYHFLTPCYRYSCRLIITKYELLSIASPHHEVTMVTGLLTRPWLRERQVKFAWQLSGFGCLPEI